MEPESRRRSLIELAIELFSKTAYEAVSPSDIARLAGISRALLYHYFSNKQGLYVAAVREVIRRVDQITAPNPELDFDEALRDALTRFFHFVNDHPRVYRARGAGGTSLHRESEQIIDGLRKTTVRRVLEFRKLEDAPENLRMVVYGWVASVEFTAAAWLEDPKVPISELVESLAATLTRVLEDFEAQA